MLTRTRNIVVLIAALFAGTVGMAYGQELNMPDPLTGGPSISVTSNDSGHASLNVSPDSLTFRQLTATPPASQKITIGVRSGTLGAFTAAATSTGNWLSVNPASGTGSTTLTVSVNTTGLKAGEYSGGIAINATGFPVATVRVNLQIFGSTGGSPGPIVTPPTSVLILRPNELEFHGTAGGTAPSPGSLEIFNPAGDNFTWTAAASVTTPSGSHWLSVTPLTGTGKTVLKVQADPSSLTAGEFNGTVTVTSGANTATTKVQFEVEGARSAKLSVEPRALNFNIDPASTKPVGPQTVDVKSTGSSAASSWTATAAVDKPTNGTWLSITPASGTTPGKITVSVNATGLAAGTYSGKVTVKSGTDSSSAQVYLRVLGPSKATVSVSPREMRFHATTGASGAVTPASRIIKVATTSTTSLTYTATATTAKGGSWLKITPASGPLPGSIATSVDAAIATKLAPGFYTGAVQVTVAGAAKESNTVHVGLKVFSTDEKPRLEVEPGGVSFQAILGGSDPATKTVTLEPEGAASLAWTSSVSMATPTGGTWLSISPASGTTTAAANSAVTVSAKIAGLAVGTYMGTVVFTPDPASGAPAAHLRVVLVVAATGTVKPSPPKSDLDASGAAVASGDLLAFFTSPADGFITDLAAPPNIGVTVLDSSGAAVEGATVRISSSNGEPDLVLTEVGGGQYEGAFRALAGGSLTLTGSATLGTQASATFGVSGDVEVSADQPTIIFQGGAVSAASFAASPSPLAPGSLVTIFGKGMAGAGGSASSVPLPKDMGGVSVTVGGMAAPLLSADPNNDQISLQIPFELDGQAQADIVVNNNGVLSQPETVTIAAAPALFTTSMSGVGAGVFVHNGNFSLITASNPATAGESIVLYATGLGTVRPSVNTGDAASGAASVAASAAVTIGGQPAQVQFAGLAPGWVGLYQINVVVPSGLPSGDALVVLSVDGTPATGQATVALK